MSEDRQDAPELKVEERYFLQKFDGDSTDPADEVERIEFDKDLNVIAIHQIENGEIVSTEHVDPA